MRKSSVSQLLVALTFLTVPVIPQQANGQARLLADLEILGFGSSPPSYYGANSWTLGGNLYFKVEDDQGNRSLWQYDGISTQKVYDGDINGDFGERIDNRVVFMTFDQFGGRVLNRLENSVVTRIEVESGASLHYFYSGIRFRDQILLPGMVSTASFYDDGVIWSTDGYSISRAYTSPYRYGNLPYKMAATSEGVYLFFHFWNYDDGSTNFTGERVWFLEGGTGPGTLVHEFEAINGQRGAIQKAVAIDNVLYLSVDDYGNGPRALWRMTPSSVESIPLGDGIGLGEHTMTAVENRLYFITENNVWYVEGTQAVRIDSRWSISASPMMVHDGNVYFAMREDGSSPWLLYRHSARESDVVRVDDRPFTHFPNNLGDYIVQPEGIYFKATDQTYVQDRGSVTEFWFTDGSSIERVSDNASDFLTSNYLVGILGNELLISAYRWPDPYQLWALNLTGNGGNAAVNHTLSGFDQSGDAFNWILDTVAPVDSGYVFGPNIYGDQAKAVAFSLPDQAAVGALNSVTLWWGHKRDGLSGGTYDVNIYNGSSQTGPQGAPIFSKSYAVVDIVGDADEGTPPQPMTYAFDSPVTVGSDFFVAVDFGQYSADLIGGMTLAAGNLTGQSVPEVWEQWGNGEWHTVSSAWLNDSNGWQLWAEVEVSIGGSVAYESEATLPEEFALHPNYPNPFNPTTEIGYSITTSGHVTLEVFDLTGRRVRQLVNRNALPGRYTVRMDAGMLPSGVYFYRLLQNGQVQTRSMVLLK